MFIECKDLTFRYPGTDKDVFTKLNCRISGPGFHSLFGHSGVGKTTLAKILAGEIRDYSKGMTTHNVKQTLYSYNLERLPGWCSVGEHLEEITPASEKDKLSDLVGLFGLQPCLNSRFSNLSLGQQNRINLLRYLLQRSDLLIMDESLANVDEATREHIILKIKEMFPARSFLYISHNIQEVSKLCKHIWVLRSAHRAPQMAYIMGQDCIKGRSADKNDLERTILEVIHAA
jgi:ABC-type nitrate/sulfonate/bicarbonate transport system ATPase subunit